MIKKYYKYLLIIINFLLIILIIIGVFSYNKYYNIEESTSKEKIKKEKIEEVEKPVYNNELPKYRSTYNNNDIVARLEIPNIGINSLVTKTTDNSYYLKHNLYNQEDGLGVPFIDFRNNDLSNDRQINIYGHNTENVNVMDKLPFINLIKYKDKNIFDKEKIINLYLDQELVTYEIISIKITTKTYIDHMNIKFNDDKEFLAHYKLLLEDSLFQNDNLKISKKDKLLILQVCNYDPKDTYLFVMARKVRS